MQIFLTHFFKVRRKLQMMQIASKGKKIIHKTRKKDWIWEHFQILKQMGYFHLLAHFQAFLGGFIGKMCLFLELWYISKTFLTFFSHFCPLQSHFLTIFTFLAPGKLMENNALFLSISAHLDGHLKIFMCCSFCPHFPVMAL